LAIILALLAGGALGGLWGMILATPLAAVIKIGLAHWVPVIAPLAPTEGEAPRRRPAPLALDLGAFTAQTWKAIRAAGRELDAARQRLGDLAGLPGSSPPSPPPTQQTEESQHDDSGA
jgi:hypothetical protein